MPAALILGGFDAVAPGQARVVALSGRYQGTVRVTGLRWVNPFTLRKRMSTRIRNHETTTLKVDVADGNPIEMAAVVVWQVSDAAKASYAVEDVRAFVTTQAETAVRHIAGQLSEELARRIEVAGVSVVESRITRLSYAAEIAQAMLRRQQEKLVDWMRRQGLDGEQPAGRAVRRPAGTAGGQRRDAISVSRRPT